MSLYADISEANKYPSRNDLHKCVFNKDRNVSVCDRKWQNLFIQRNSPGILRPLRLNYNTASIAFVHLEKFPWNFAASQAQLQHSVNRLEFEVYSVPDGKRYASMLSIPDMHLFDYMRDIMIITFQVLLENSLYPLHKHSKHLPAQTIQK